MKLITLEVNLSLDSRYGSKLWSVRIGNQRYPELDREPGAAVAKAVRQHLMETLLELAGKETP